MKAAVKRRTRYVVESERAIIYGPRRTFEFDLTGKYLHIERQRSRGHSTFVFTSVDPRTNGKITLILVEKSGLDAHLSPGRETRFKLVDVQEDESLQAAISSTAFRGRAAPRSA